MNELRVGAPLAVGGTILIPVERVVITATSHRCGHWLSASKEVAAMVVCEPDGPRVIDMQAREMPLEELIRQMPALGAAIGKCAAG